MKRKWRIVIFLTTALLLITAAGCGSRNGDDKPLWQRLEDAQYNTYKPRLDHMVEKYGDMFEMNVYGDVYCTDSEYHSWRIRIAGDNVDASPIDNFSIRLRRDDIELFIQEIAEPIFGECKVYVCDGFSSKLDADADTEDFFTYKHGLVYCWIYVPYSEDYQTQGEAFIAAILERGYKLWMLDVLYYDDEQYEQVDRDWVDLGVGPKGYQFRLDASYYNTAEKFDVEWRGNEE